MYENVVIGLISMVLALGIQVPEEQCKLSLENWKKISWLIQYYVRHNITSEVPPVLTAGSIILKKTHADEYI